MKKRNFKRETYLWHGIFGDYKCPRCGSWASRWDTKVIDGQLICGMCVYKIHKREDKIKRLGRLADFIGE